MKHSVAFAILAAALIIGAAIFASNYTDRYQIVTTVSNGDPVAWRLDRHTGDIVLCEIAPDPFAGLVPGTRPVDRFVVQCGN
jgi:hypothetical protein